MRPPISPSHRFLNLVRRTRKWPSSTMGSSSQVSKENEAVAVAAAGMSETYHPVPVWAGERPAGQAGHATGPAAMSG